ncbi:head GIN domain-containing protein [Zhouia sp. PK063]|uniref:head GIN domain-containing protein n=1 Tax=Zhouia sp. PK063 TaxID=3373602 RepID=UPI0037969B39
MTTLIKFIVTIMAALLFSSCNFNFGVQGNGNVVTENRDISESFTQISSAQGIDIYLKQDEKTTIKVEADENLINLIQTNVNGNELVVKASKNLGMGTKKVYITLPDVSKLSTSSGASINTENHVNIHDLDIEASSGSDIKVNISADNVYSSTSSGATIVLTGTAHNITAEASSGSNIKANDLEVKFANGSASSGANISFNAQDKFTADESSGGNVNNQGKAPKMKE